jgi:hypothetical protein
MSVSSEERGKVAADIDLIKKLCERCENVIATEVSQSTGALYGKKRMSHLEE